MSMKKGTSEDSIQHPGDFVVSERVLDRLRASKYERHKEEYEKKENYERRVHQAEGYMRRFTQVMDNAINRNFSSIEKKLNIPEVCKKEQDKVKNCYKDNSDQSLKCDKEVQEYFSCVKDNKEKRVLK